MSRHNATAVSRPKPAGSLGLLRRANKGKLPPPPLRPFFASLCSRVRSENARCARRAEALAKTERRGGVAKKKDAARQTRDPAYLLPLRQRRSLHARGEALAERPSPAPPHLSRSSLSPRPPSPTAGTSTTYPPVRRTA